jgi:hypothetical protein
MEKQHNGDQNKKDKMANKDLQNTTQKTKEIPTKNRASEG